MCTHLHPHSLPGIDPALLARPLLPPISRLLAAIALRLIEHDYYLKIWLQSLEDRVARNVY